MDGGRIDGCGGMEKRGLVSGRSWGLVEVLGDAFIEQVINRLLSQKTAVPWETLLGLYLSKL